MIFYQVVLQIEREGEEHRGFFETETQARNWAELESAWERLGTQLVRPLSVEDVVVYRCQLNEIGSSPREEIYRRRTEIGARRK